MTDQFAALRVFVRLAHTGSFSKTARELKLSQPTASRMISDLEKHLGVTLFTRTTRAVVLTQAGAEYLDDVQPILHSLAEADHRIRGGSELQGALRVAMASVTASRLILPRLKSFMDEHPQLNIHLFTEDRRQDLILEGIDVALRSGDLSDSSALARRIGSWPLIIAGAPSYLSEHGAPETPADLAAHSFIVAGPAAAQTLELKKNNQCFPLKMTGRLTVQGTDAAVAAGREGLGLVVATLPTLLHDIEAGALKRLMPDWDLGEIGAHALFPSGQSPKPAARAFVEFAIEVMNDIEHQWRQNQLSADY
jgi:DNA-binding transcriptional LysR family regulator